MERGRGKRRDKRREKYPLCFRVLFSSIFSVRMGGGRRRIFRWAFHPSLWEGAEEGKDTADPDVPDFDQVRADAGKGEGKKRNIPSSIYRSKGKRGDRRADPDKVLSRIIRSATGEKGEKKGI